MTNLRSNGGVFVLVAAFAERVALLARRFSPRKTRLSLEPHVCFLDVEERTHQHQPIVVLRDAAIAQLAVTPHALQEVKRMLNQRPDAALYLVGHVLLGRQRLVTEGAISGAVERVGGGRFNHMRLPNVRTVAIHALLASMQQRWQRLAVVYVRRGGGDAMNQPRLRIGSDVQLHAKVPVVALLGRAHLLVSAIRAVLGRGRGADDAGVYHRAFGYFQPLLRQQRIDQSEELVCELLRFEQAAKAQQRGGIRYPLAPQIDHRKPAKYSRVVQRLLARLIGQVEPQLQKVQPQHPLQPDRRATIANLRVVRFDQLAQRFPRHQLVHLLQKLRLARHFAVHRKLQPVYPRTGKTSLFHRLFSHRLVNTSSTMSQWTCSVFPNVVSVIG